MHKSSFRPALQTKQTSQYKYKSTNVQTENKYSLLRPQHRKVITKDKPPSCGMERPESCGVTPGGRGVPHYGIKHTPII